MYYIHCFLSHYKFIEAILSQPQIISSIDAKNRKTLLKETLKNMLIKTNKWLILSLLVFCSCANDQTPENERLEKEHNPVQYNECTTISYGECFPEVSDKYVHPPIQNESPHFNEDPYNARFQVPDDVLKSISTPGLIDALIQSPYFTWFYPLSSDCSAIRWQRYYDLYNCAIELFQREDAGKALVAYYKLVNLVCIFSLPSSTTIEIVESYEENFKLLGLECLFTMPEILDKMDRDKKKEAVVAFLENCKSKNYSDDWLRIYPMVHIMIADKYGPIIKYAQEHVDEFCCTFEGTFYPSNTKQWDTIVSFAKDFINDKN